MTMHCDYDSVVGVISHIEIDKTHPLFTLFSKNTAVEFLLVVKMAGPRPLREAKTAKDNTT